MPELIADSMETYGERLLELVTNPVRLAGYSRHLRTTRDRNPLFDTAGFARDWESLLLQIYDDAASDPSPQGAS
jgi:predicted O-linked N-acetylglucosamine transferase (SPINDLY family)